MYLHFHDEKVFFASVEHHSGSGQVLNIILNYEQTHFSSRCIEKGCVLIAYVRSDWEITIFFVLGLVQKKNS